MEFDVDFDQTAVDLGHEMTWNFHEKPCHISYRVLNVCPINFHGTRGAKSINCFTDEEHFRHVSCVLEYFISGFVEKFLEIPAGLISRQKGRCS